MKQLRLDLMTMKMNKDTFQIKLRKYENNLEAEVKRRVGLQNDLNEVSSLSLAPLLFVCVCVCVCACVYVSLSLYIYMVI